MFCPMCGTEYVEGIIECADCHVPLTTSRPPDPEPITYEDVVATHNPGDIAIMKSMLEGSGIRFFFKTEFFNQMEPLIQPAVLAVRREDAARARELLRGLDLTFLGVSGAQS
jgi:hypothetical protein